MDFFLYQVSRRWYRILWAIMLVFSAAIASLYLAAQFAPSLATYAEQLHVTDTTFIICFVGIGYLAGIHWLVTRYSLPFATLLGSMVFFMLLLQGISSNTGESGAWIYLAAWAVTTFLNGMYGLPFLAGSVFISYVYISLVSNFQYADLETDSIVMVISAVVIAAISYWFWKDKFVSLESQRLNQLSGQLSSNQKQSEILIQSIADGIIVINNEGKITLINPAAAELTGWTVADAIGVDAQLVAKLTKEDGSEITPEEDPFALIFTNKQHITQIAQITDKEGTKRVISLVVSPILMRDTSIDGAIAVMRDISDQRAAEKQRAEFISTASHEMRTPVAAIEGYLSLALNDKVSTIDTRARGYLDKAHASTQHLGKLFQDLLTSSKAEDGRLANHPAVVEMGAFMQQLSDDLKFAAEKKGLIAEFVIGGADETIDATTKDASVQHLVKPLYYVFADPDRMREVITNLFDNACKYTDTGKISLGLTGNAEVVQLYIRDTGAGIPKDDIPHLFQKFYRVDNSATRTIGGTGLGLFISRKIIELYHGRIWVESEVGKGSTFFINLPRLTTQRATELQANESKTTQTASTETAQSAPPTSANTPPKS